MNCANHPEKTAVAFCRECGKPMCDECQRPALGSVYCAEHLPFTAAPPPPPLPEQPRAASSGYTSSPYSAPANRVLTTAGASALTRTFGASSTASWAVRLISAALLTP